MENIELETGEEIPAEVIPDSEERLAEIAEYEAGAYQRELDAVALARHNAYTAPDGSDAIFMKYQRDEATKEEWLAAKKAIDDANPYPPAPKTKK